MGEREREVVRRACVRERCVRVEKGMYWSGVEVFSLEFLDVG